MTALDSLWLHWTVNNFDTLTGTYLCK